MSLFHIANDGKTITIMSVDSGYTIERALENIPHNVCFALKDFFETRNLNKPSWTRTGVMLSHDHPVYLWFLFEKSEELRSQEQEPAVESVSALNYYAANLPTSTYEQFEAYNEYASHELYPEDR